MIKFLHTADWHIGQYFYGYDRKHEHIVFFDWLKNIAKERQIDVLLISGDIFDSPNPSAESQKLYYKFLHEITTANPLLQIIITAGNHDSAARLEAPNPLLEQMNVTVRGIVKRDADGEIRYDDLLVPVRQNGTTVAWCIAVPYLRQGDYPASETYSRGVTAMYHALYDRLDNNRNGKPVILMGHLQATGSSVLDDDRSERSIIGGLECIPPTVFDKEGVIYTALGHLHKSQYVSGREHVRYSGSPLPMSFAEKNYKQGINLIEIGDDNSVNIEKIEFDTPVKLVSIPKKPLPLAQVLSEIETLPDGPVTQYSPYLELKVLLTEPEPALRHKIEAALANKSVRLACAVSHRKQGESVKTLSYEDMQVLSPLDIAEDLFMRIYGEDMPDKLKLLFQTVIEEVEK